eukprot:TRINITY_DN30801_c0_g2_i1.p1 TRINITY_DN30801_c0_g2~~TRINITY_DN30801_c0_g2_i1.p1  ORF type:complete len:858 (+),score=265.72 TRINITY_DN30801_c0_g2_i1:110-2683(+)
MDAAYIPVLGHPAAGGGVERLRSSWRHSVLPRPELTAFQALNHGLWTPPASSSGSRRRAERTSSAHSATSSTDDRVRWLASAAVLCSVLGSRAGLRNDGGRASLVQRHAREGERVALRNAWKRKFRKAPVLERDRHAIEMSDAEDKRLVREISEYLKRVGGQAKLKALKTLFAGRAREAWLRQRFDVDEPPQSDVAKNHFQAVVRLKPDEEQSEFELEEVMQRVAKRLVKLGGSAELHDTTRRFGTSKKKLLAYKEGKHFEVADGKLYLKGALRAVAAAAAASGNVPKHIPGRQKKGSLLTSQGHALDAQLAESLRLRIDAFLTSEGDGRMSRKDTYEALGLTPSPALKRWLKRATGLKMTASSDFQINNTKLMYYRVRRALNVASLLAKNNGFAPLVDVIDLIHRPTEFDMLPSQQGDEDEDEEDREKPREENKRREKAPEDDGSDAKKTFLLPQVAEAGESSALGPLLSSKPSPQEYWKDASMSRLSYLEMESAEEVGSALATLPEDVHDGDEHKSSWRPHAPLWIPIWIRNYFEVDGDLVTFPEGPKPWKKPAPSTDPDAPPPLTMDDEKANLLMVEEELRLRYGRAHVSVLTGNFPGVRKSWLKRFFDITMYDDVLAKSTDRQVHEAIAVAKRIFACRMEAAATAGSDDKEASGEAFDDFESFFGGDDGEEEEEAKPEAMPPAPQASSSSAAGARGNDVASLLLGGSSRNEHAVEAVPESAPVTTVETAAAAQQDEDEEDSTAYLRNVAARSEEAKILADPDKEGQAYTSDDAFRDYGCSMGWLRAHFLVEEDTGLLALDDDSNKDWVLPAQPPKAPNPWTYAKLDVPRGYIRKGNGKYLNRRYGRSAGGILY